MKKTEDAPYLEKKDDVETTKEQLIYGGGDTLQEVESDRNKKKEQMITEDAPPVRRG